MKRKYAVIALKFDNIRRIHTFIYIFSVHYFSSMNITSAFIISLFSL